MFDGTTQINGHHELKARLATSSFSTDLVWRPTRPRSSLHAAGPSPPGHVEFQQPPSLAAGLAPSSVRRGPNAHLGLFDTFRGHRIAPAQIDLLPFDDVLDLASELLTRQLRLPLERRRVRNRHLPVCL